jgi:hypothetical protein
MGRLARLIDEHGEALHFDFMTYTPFLLKELVTDDSPLTPREVIAAIRNFPPDSATAASMRGGPEFRGWDNTVYMLANVVDAIRENTYVFVAANSKRKPKPPKPVDRPTAKKKPGGPTGSRFALMARMARLNAEKKAKRKANQDDESGRA